MIVPKLDLELLRIFDVMFAERSVTRTAEEVGLSQPAVSHALNRLRKAVGDELFERSPYGMKPTPRAVEMAVPLRKALSEIMLAIAPLSFHPKTSTASFRIAVYNYASTILLGPLARRLRSQAPEVIVRIVPGEGRSIAKQIENGEIDMAIGGEIKDAQNLMTTALIRDQYVCVFRKGHPLGERPFTLDAFVEHPQVMISLNGQNENYLDQLLARASKRRRVVMTAPHFLAAASVMQETDLITAVVERTAEKYAPLFGLDTRELPFEGASVPCHIYWHHSLQENQANKWMRSLFVEVANEIKSGASFGDTEVQEDRIEAAE